MVSKGRKVNGHSKPAPAGPSPETKLLGQILAALQTRPLPTFPKIPEPKAPVVNVAPAPVTVQPAKPITKWKFVLTKDKAGHTTEITATAIE